MKKGQHITKLPPTITECTVEQLQALSQSPPVQTGRHNAKVTPRDVEQIAVLVAKRMTETEACAVIGITPKQWFDYKSRKLKDSQFTDMIAQVRGQYINARLGEIEASAKGDGMKQRDWRAAAWLAQVSGGDRYSTAGNARSENLTVNVIADERLDKVLARLYDVSSKQIEQNTHIKAVTSEVSRLADKPEVIEVSEA